MQTYFHGAPKKKKGQAKTTRKKKKGTYRQRRQIGNKFIRIYSKVVTDQFRWDLTCDLKVFLVKMGLMYISHASKEFQSRIPDRRMNLRCNQLPAGRENCVSSIL